MLQSLLKCTHLLNAPDRSRLIILCCKCHCASNTTPTLKILSEPLNSRTQNCGRDLCDHCRQNDRVQASNAGNCPRNQSAASSVSAPLLPGTHRSSSFSHVIGAQCCEDKAEALAKDIDEEAKEVARLGRQRTSTVKLCNSKGESRCELACPRITFGKENVTFGKNMELQSWRAKQPCVNAISCATCQEHNAIGTNMLNGTIKA
eukprot:4074200-Amphidinium_carterae.1